MTAAISRRIAGAPASWGICEIPGWGHQLSADRVFTEMRRIGLGATEFGPDCFLPVEPAARARALAGFGLTAVGGFLPVVLHEAEQDPLPAVDDALTAFLATGADVLVLAAATGRDTYDERPTLSDAGWNYLVRNTERIAERAAREGIRVTVHPHFGTMIQDRDDVQRFVGSCSTALCVDTGHLLVGGTDPAELVRADPGRVGHVHLKDVDAACAARVASGELTYSQAVKAGLYTPLGGGDVDVAGIVRTLEGHGYTGWYVLEQDLVLDGEPIDVEPGPAANVRASVEFVQALLSPPSASDGPARETP
jgi:inosose dehydratase